MEQYSKVVERVEQVRKQLGLNKSRFSGAIGMKSTTYNNFVGKQASRPNLTLVLGIVNRYSVSPNWLLNGTGPVFTPMGAQKALETLHAFNSAGISAPPAMPQPVGPESTMDTPRGIEQNLAAVAAEAALTAREISNLRKACEEFTRTLEQLIKKAKAGV